MTKYVILRSEQDQDSYAPIGEFEAANDEKAITSFLEAGDNGEKHGEGDYRAVPKRSWTEKPRSIRRRVVYG